MVAAQMLPEDSRRWLDRGNYSSVEIPRKPYLANVRFLDRPLALFRWLVLCLRHNPAFC